MRELLVEADRHADALRMARRERGERRFVLALAAPEHANLRAELEELVRRRAQEIDALLVREAAHRAKERRCRLLGEIEPPLQRRLVAALALEARPGIALGDQRVVHRIPQLGVDAVDDAAQDAAALAQHAVQPAARLLALDLARISRAHRGDGVGVDQPALQEREAPVELHALDREAGRRQLEALEQRGIENSLEGEVMHRHHGAGATVAEMQIHGRERRGPVVAMQDLRPPFERRGAACEERRGARQHAKAQPVVRPVLARAILVGTAFAVVQRRRIDEQVVALLEQAHVGAEEAQPRPLFRAGEVDLSVARQEHAHVNPLRAQRRRQRRTDVTEPARFRQRGALRCHEQYAHKKRPR